MKLSDYIAQNGDREIDSEKLDEVLQIKRSKVWKPQYGEVYWFVTSVGVVNTTWYDSEEEAFLYETGNVFPTKEDAQAYAKYLKTQTALKRYAQEHNEGEIDWHGYVKNWTLVYDFAKKKIRVEWTNVGKICGVYFTSKKIAKAAIDEIGEERIKQYLLYEG